MNDTIILPIEVKDLLGKSIFTVDGLVNDDYLNKYLFYMPEVIRIFGVGIAQLKAKQRSIELDLWKLENTELEKVKSRVLLTTLDSIDAQKYRNEQLRTARVVSDSEYQAIVSMIEQKKRDLMIVEKEIDELKEEVWKYKNLMQALDNISKLRISERRY